MYKFIFLVSIILLTIACGSSNDTKNCRSETEIIDSITVNQILGNDDISLFATYDMDSAALVIDGDPTEGSYWSGISSDDYLEIDLGRVVSATQIDKYLEIKNDVNNFGELYNLEVSTDGVTWQKTFFSPSPFEDDRTYSCTTLGLTECKLRQPNPGFRYIRFVYTSIRQDDVLSVGLREVAVFSREALIEEKEVCE